MRLSVRVLSFLSALTLAVILGAGVATAKQPDGDAFVPLRPNAAHSQRPGGGGASNLLSFRGGNVQISTDVYIVFWGAEWNSTTGPNNHTNQNAMDYVSRFFTNVGGSPWINTDNQYCQGVAAGTTNCLSVWAP